MGTPLYMRSVVDRNVVMRHIPVVLSRNFGALHHEYKTHINFHSDAFRHLLTPSFQGVQSTEIFFSTTVE